MTGFVTEQQALAGWCAAPAGAGSSVPHHRRWGRWDRAGTSVDTTRCDVCLQVGHPEGAQRHLCSALLVCFPEFNQEETPGKPQVHNNL